MKKAFKTYLAVWALLLALFNVIAFVSVGWIGQEKYTASFWIGYVFITVAFLGQLVCAYIAMKDDNDLKKIFLNISLLSASYSGLIASFVIGGLCMLISPLPYWVGVIVCAVVLVLNVLAVIKAKVAVEAVDKVDEKIKSQTFFIKSLTVDADTLVALAKSEEIKAECRKVYEAVRYSDPVSNDALAGYEEQIEIEFGKLSEAVKANDLEIVKEMTDTVLVLIRDRNNKCKLLKRG